MNEKLQHAGVVEQTPGGYRCRVCDKDVTDIDPHLLGKDHFNNLAWEAIRNPTPHQFFLDALPSVVLEAKENSEMESVDKTRFSYRCLVCPRRPISDGIKSLADHLEGKDHKKAKTQQANAPLHPADVPLELQRALTAGVVVPGEGGPPSFKCRACDKDFNGPVPCSQHLEKEKHKKKEQAWKQRFHSDSGPGDGSREFRWTVVTGTRPFPPSDSVYRNLSVPHRGLVLIFNYFTGQGEHERLGAERDSFNLQTLFDRMSYKVDLYEDCSKSQTEEALTRTLNNPCLKDYDSFIVFILSHGRDDQIFFTTSFNEEDSMKLDDVRYKFTDTACPPLHGKPKLFFVNFCRARAEQHTAYDGMAPHSPGPKNIVTLYSCINTFKSPRDPENGTFFVQAWCKVLAAHAHDEELRDLHYRVCQRLEEMNGSVPELQIYHFKKFYFNPCRPLGRP